MQNFVFRGGATEPGCDRVRPLCSATQRDVWFCVWSVALWVQCRIFERVVIELTSWNSSVKQSWRNFEMHNVIAGTLIWNVFLA